MKDYRVHAIYPDGTEDMLNVKYPNDIAAVIEFNLTAKVTNIKTWLMINDENEWIAIDGQLIH